jgi:hypothetical protein
LGKGGQLQDFKKNQNMYLKRIEDANIFYLSSNNSGLGETLIQDSLANILQFVETNLFNENTDYQNDAIFENLGNDGVVTEVGKWYAIELNPNLYQIILTEDLIKYNLPQRPTWTGSLNDLISFLFNKLSE